MKEKLQIISRNIKKQRLTSGLSEKKVASLLNITVNQYLEYENNPKDLSMGFLEKIAVVLQCNVADFFMENIVTLSDERNEENSNG